MIYWAGQPGSSVVMPDAYLPDYRRVADDLRTKMRTGEYAPGSKLPSKRELCTLYGVSTQTVDTAMIVLREGGWVRGRQGAGVWVADPLPETAR